MKNFFTTWLLTCQEFVCTWRLIRSGKKRGRRLKRSWRSLRTVFVRLARISRSNLIFKARSHISLSTLNFLKVFSGICKLIWNIWLLKQNDKNSWNIRWWWELLSVFEKLQGWKKEWDLHRKKQIQQMGPEDITSGNNGCENDVLWSGNTAAPHLNKDTPTAYFDTTIKPLIFQVAFTLQLPWRAYTF